MAKPEYVLAVVLAVCFVHGCHSTSVQDEAIMARLAVLEKNQRENQAEIRALHETVAEQKNTIDKQSEKLKILEQNIISLKTTQQHHVNRLHRYEKLLQSLFKAGPTKEGVAFSVYLDHDETLGAGQAIKFNQIITNEGNGYTINTGVFTCPMDGMFLFSFFIGERDTGHQQLAALKVNSQNLVDAIVETMHPNQDLMGGNTVVFRLRQGDSVWIESMHLSNHIEGASSLRLSTFSGAFLYS